MSRIEVFADIVCPFTHVGLRRLSEARRGRGRRRRYVCEHGRSSGSTALRWTQIWSPTRSTRCARKSRPTCSPASMRRRFPTSIPAFGLAAAAYAVDDLTGEVVSLALRDALFERGKDISDDDVLWEIGQPFGVEPLARSVAESAIRTDWERGKARDVQGSPHFFVGDRGWFCPSWTSAMTVGDSKSGRRKTMRLLRRGARVASVSSWHHGRRSCSRAP